MKRNTFNAIILSTYAFLSLCGCSEESISRYNGDSYIYFTKNSNDSTIFSFAYDESLQEGDVNLKLNIISRLENRDRTFSVRTVQEESSAQEGRDFTLSPQSMIVKANDSIAYLNIHVKKDNALKGKTFKAVFEIVPSEDFLPGITKNRKANLIITDLLARPDWWDAWHESSGLGTYSDKKYRLFIEVTHQEDLTLIEDGGNMSYTDMRSYVVTFKYWLMENPQTEDDGSQMTVPVIG